jgi:hypothetical protein
LRTFHESVSKKIQEIRRRIPVEGLNKFDHKDIPVPDLIDNETFIKHADENYPGFTRLVNHLETSDFAKPTWIPNESQTVR